ncbi:tail-collar fiber protein [Pseudomonas sp. URMO17WK12:I10]|uniref:phage tail-collar fiber domain-containing protein n=1 Tax=unclassified Pseudomonas TaxID=196821 RepID=UPI000487C047|nr:MULTISPECIES: phage tail protein [unclassified Pseudomonas]RDL18506.1 tail-collar fiber protein [Pseudomonas sp. LAMO17WK12:I3]RED04064.1 tail-collar fiber protein [Pseudomonas sp. URMO17WK12:I10]SOD10278.1 Phage-related tail fibre protein [Pseudomonas sp. URMO17WK12:I9]
MSTALKPLITKAGLAAIWNATSTGLKAEIAYIGLGDQGFTPTVDQTTLRGLVAQYPVAGGEKLSSSLIHLTALADDGKAFWVRSVGFYLADGTLFAVWSSTGDPLTFKPAAGDLLLAYDLSLEALPADSVTIVSTATGLNLTLAGPLAAQASALVAEMMRGVQQQDQLDTQAKQLRVAGELLGNLTERMKACETRQESDREGLLTAVVANATALINLQNMFSQKTLGV